MDKIKIQVSGNAIQVTQCPGCITSGTIGLQAEFTFDNEWDGLTKLAVFQAGTVAKAVEVTESEVVVPWEVLEKPYVRLHISVYGINAAGSIAIPTVWTSACTIKPGADPDADPATAPTAPIWQELANRIAILEEGGAGTGGISIEAVNEAIQEAMNTHLQDENPHKVMPVGGVFTDYNAVTAPGLYEADEKAEKIDNAPSGYSKFKRGTLLVEAMSLNGTTQIQQTATYMNIVAKRYSTSGGNSWGNWEYINPPMLAGTEYRTTERCLDKAVYTKLIKCGEPYDCMGVTLSNSRINVIRHTGYITRTGDTIPLPNGEMRFEMTPDSPDMAAIFYGSNDSIETADPAYTLYLQIWYTK